MKEELEYLLSRVGFEPHPNEQATILEAVNEHRFFLVAGGDQAGKSLEASKGFLAKWFEDMSKFEGEDLLYWFVAADYERTRAEFDYAYEDFVHLFGESNVYVTKRVDPGYIEVMPRELRRGRQRKATIRIETKSAKDPRRLAMRAPHGIVICEASQVDLNTYERCQGRVAPTRGWIHMSGSFESSLGWYPQLWRGWQAPGRLQRSFSLPTWSNLTLFPGGRNDPEILRLERENSSQWFMERMAGIPMPPKGLVFDEFRPDIHVREAAWNPDKQVQIWIDPGYAGAFALEAAQEIDGQMRVFDEIYQQGLTTEQIADIAINLPWWGKALEGPGIVGVADVASQQHQAMASVQETWLDKTGVWLGGRKVDINEGTERLKSFLKPDPITGEPKIIFDPKCTGILSEFGSVGSPIDGQERAYRWRMDREGNIVGHTPEDKNNHGVKAVIYGLVDRYGLGYVGSGANGSRRSKIPVKRW